MRAERTASGALRLRCESPQEWLDLCTREILGGSLFARGAPEDGLSEGDALELELEHPGGRGALQLPGEVERVERGAPKGIRVRLRALAPEARSVLEAAATALLRGAEPESWPEPAGERAGPQRELDREADRALLLQEEATGKAVEGRSVQSQLQQMALPEKIQLAMRGGKAARASLLRDTAPAVHAALARNPRVTLPEILDLARSPGTGAEAIGLIAASTTFMADAAIRFEIVCHPRTPPQQAQRWLTRLLPAQLRQLSRSDRVRGNLRSQALRMLEKRRA